MKKHPESLWLRPKNQRPAGRHLGQLHKEQIVKMIVINSSRAVGPKEWTWRNIHLTLNNLEKYTPNPKEPMDMNLI